MKNMTVIVANGEFPGRPAAERMLREAEFVCVCDGAAEEMERRGLHFDVVVGDGDSLPEELKERYGERFVHVCEQEDNDLTKATRYCVEHGFREIVYLGCTGKREDHALGNISLMIEYMRRFGIRGTMITDYGRFVPCKGKETFRCKAGQQVSIFNFGCTRLESKGLVYPTRAFDNWWQGTLNECVGDEFVVDGDGEWMVFLEEK